MGLFDDLFEDNKKKSNEAYGLFNFMNEQQNNNNKYSDKELDIYDLEDWQKKEIKKGNYNPWNFEEDDLEEDDYYSEDD